MGVDGGFEGAGVALDLREEEPPLERGEQGGRQVAGADAAREVSRGGQGAQSVASRSPRPPHPAVPGRRDFVEAAPALPADPRIRLPPASPRRCDGREIEVFHPHSDKQRLVAHVHPRYMCALASRDADR
jgi:hypothetical protein